MTQPGRRYPARGYNDPEVRRKRAEMTERGKPAIAAAASCRYGGARCRGLDGKTCACDWDYTQRSRPYVPVTDQGDVGSAVGHVGAQALTRMTNTWNRNITPARAQDLYASAIPLDGGDIAPVWQHEPPVGRRHLDTASFLWGMLAGFALMGVLGMALAAVVLTA